MRAQLLLALLLSAFQLLKGELLTQVDWNGHGFLPPLPIADVNSTNDACRRDSRLLVAALLNRTLWAEQMWDASAKRVAGLLSGGTAQLGDFDGCLAVRRPIASHYCLATLHLAMPPKHLPYPDPHVLDYPLNASAWDKIHFGGSFAKQSLEHVRMAMCVPSNCGPSEVQASLTRYLEHKGVVSEVKIQESACSNIEDTKYNFTTRDIVFCLVMLAVFLVISSATIYDMLVYEYDEKSPPANYVQCLSAYRGFKSLFRRDQGIAELDLSPLYGVHVFSFIIIVIVHRFGVYYILGNVTNYEDVERMYRNYWISMWSSHPDLFVDIFFFLSAFLLAVILSLQLEKGHISPLKIYLHRYIRLVPSYAVVVFFYAFLLEKISNGPLWNEIVGYESDLCKEYWWANLLFINTYLGGYSTCLIQSWYICCDFQLFLAGTLILFLLNRRPVLGLVVSALLFLASSIAVFLYTYVHDLPATVTMYKEAVLNVRDEALFQTVYTQSHFRAPGYLIGLIAGYGVFRKREVRMDRSKSWLLLSSGFTICLLVYWSGALYTDPGRPYTRLESALYASTFHSVFAVGFSLILTSTVLGVKSFVTAIFSWRGFVPFSKLSYGVFLTHVIMQLVSTGSARLPVTLNTHSLLSWTVADLAFGTCFSMVLYLFVETPCRYLFKHIFSTKSRVHVLNAPAEVAKDEKDTVDWSRRLANP